MYLINFKNLLISSILFAFTFGSYAGHPNSDLRIPPAKTIEKTRYGRLVWEGPLEELFIGAISVVGADAHPSKILEYMQNKHPGLKLTRAQINSHLQWYKQKRKHKEASFHNIGPQTFIWKHITVHTSPQVKVTNNITNNTTTITNNIVVANSPVFPPDFIDLTSPSESSEKEMDSTDSPNFQTYSMPSYHDLLSRGPSDSHSQPKAQKRFPSYDELLGKKQPEQPQPKKDEICGVIYSDELLEAEAERQRIKASIREAELYMQAFRN